MTEQEARELGVEAAARQVDDRAGADARRRRGARRHPQRAPGARPRDAGAWSTPTLLGELKPGAILHQHRARRGRRSRRAGGGRPRQGTARRARRLRERAGGRDRRVQRRARRPAGRLRHASHRRLHRSGAGSDRRRDGAHHPELQGDRAACRTSSTSRSARRRRTCWSSATATGRACWRTCSTILRAANLNVQETENIVFEGAEAAVARINLDGAPAPALVRRDQERERGHPRSAGGARCECRASDCSWD